MTLPAERTRAVLQAKDFLQRLGATFAGIKGVPAPVREEARRILRHYPHWFDLGRKDAFDADAAQRIADTETDSEWRLGVAPHQLPQSVTKRQVRARKVPK